MVFQSLTKVRQPHPDTRSARVERTVGITYAKGGTRLRVVVELTSCEREEASLPGGALRLREVRFWTRLIDESVTRRRSPEEGRRVRRGVTEPAAG